MICPYAREMTNLPLNSSSTKTLFHLSPPTIPNPKNLQQFSFMAEKENSTLMKLKPSTIFTKPINKKN